MENSKVQWCNHTWNYWQGCNWMTYQDDENDLDLGWGCVNCYAAKWGHRFGVEWGGARRLSSERIRNAPLRWNRAAINKGIRERIFFGSLMDVFDKEVDPAWRRGAVSIINQCSQLDFMLLTKRLLPNPVLGLSTGELLDMVPEWSNGVAQWPVNVWFGHSIVSQHEADFILPKMALIPAPIRFVSCEPFRDLVDFSPWADVIDAVILGGESGEVCRINNLEAMLTTADICLRAGIKVFIKQLGTYPMLDNSILQLQDKKGGNPDEWPEFVPRSFELPSTLEKLYARKPPNLPEKTC